MINESMMMHGRDYNRQDVSGWLMSEKLNGCRAYWDGENMWSRGGKLIQIPQQMRAMLPTDYHLDGEMFCPVDFNNAKRAVQYSRFSDQVVFCVFDVPSHPGPFNERYLTITRLLHPHTSYVKFVPQWKCHNIDEAVKFMRKIQADGGEGVMLHDPAAFYTQWRTDSLLKLKFWPEAL